MRKLKKINGYLVVKFNDRERRENPSLGAYGVIDAELYTGDLDLDRSEMEYDDAETLEVAVEQARGLDAEEDFTDEPPRYTVVVEDDNTLREEDVEPQLLIKGWETRLETQIKSDHYKDVDPRTAAHELYGYKVALNDLKSDLPLIYVTREDFIRVSNNIDQKLDRLLYQQRGTKEG